MACNLSLSCPPVLRRVLRAGGFWLHMGPLLWHWADGSPDELSVELSLADVQQAALLTGFRLLSQEFVDAAYIGEQGCILAYALTGLC